MSNLEVCTFISQDSNKNNDVDPIEDIIDYLIRCANISITNCHIDETEVRTNDKIRQAHEIYKKSPINFLSQYGKYLAPQHLSYFENNNPYTDGKDTDNFYSQIKELKHYHSNDCRKKRVRNRRYKAMQKLQNETDYFSENEMMYRNPLLYEQLIGQYLTEEEIGQRNNVDHENLTFLNMILDTVDRNQMREMKNEQSLTESMETIDLEEQSNEKPQKKNSKSITALWGEFEEPEKRVEHNKPEVRKQTMISAPERRLLREEFFQEMYSSFIEGRDAEVNYSTIDNDEQYDDLQQVSQDAEDRYFDSESNEVENLEEHMRLVEEYGSNEPRGSPVEDSLDVFMEHLNKKLVDN